MQAVPRPASDIIYCDFAQLRKMPNYSQLVFGWQSNSKGTYLITKCANGVRCQHWTSQEARSEILAAVKV